MDSSSEFSRFKPSRPRNQSCCRHRHHLIKPSYPHDTCCEPRRHLRLAHAHAPGPPNPLSFFGTAGSIGVRPSPSTGSSCNASASASAVSSSSQSVSSLDRQSVIQTLCIPSVGNQQNQPRRRPPGRLCPRGSRMTTPRPPRFTSDGFSSARAAEPIHHGQQNSNHHGRPRFSHWTIRAKLKVGLTFHVGAPVN